MSGSHLAVIVQRTRNPARRLAGPLLLLVIWAGVAHAGIFPPSILVSPEQVVLTGLDLIQSGELPNSILSSAARVVSGFALGGSAGLIVGLTLGLSRLADRYCGLLFETLRQIPIVAWAPMLILLCGIGEGFKLVIIANAAFFPVLLATRDGIRNVPHQYRDVAQLFRFSHWQMIRRLVLPAALPSIVTGLRLALSRSWMMVVAAELFGSDTGVGHLIEWAREMFQIDVVMVGILVIGMIGFVLDAGLRRIERALTPWQGAVA